MPKFELSRRAVTVALALVLVFFFVGAILGQGLLEEEEVADDLVAQFSVSKSMLRLGETLMCFANESEGDIDRYHWDYGDGNASSRSTGSHLYEDAGWYNVTLTISDGDRSANTTITVGVQLTDFTYLDEFGEIRHWLSHGRRDTQAIGYIGPSIGRPTVRARFELDNVMGEMSLEIGQRVGNSYRTVCSHEVIALWEDVDHVIEIEPEFIYKTSEDLVSIISAELWITNGQVKGGTITLEVVFPFE